MLITRPTAPDPFRSHLVQRNLRGCDLTLSYNHPGEPHYWLTLDRWPHSYTRTLTAAEVAALARAGRLENPEDDYAWLDLGADLSDVVTLLTGDVPEGRDWLDEISRVAVALVAAVGERTP